MEYRGGEVVVYVVYRVLCSGYMYFWLWHRACTCSR